MPRRFIKVEGHLETFSHVQEYSLLHCRELLKGVTQVWWAGGELLRGLAFLSSCYYCSVSLSLCLSFSQFLPLSLFFCFSPSLSLSHSLCLSPLLVFPTVSPLQSPCPTVWSPHDVPHPSVLYKAIWALPLYLAHRSSSLGISSLFYWIVKSSYLKFSLSFLRHCMGK